MAKVRLIDIARKAHVSESTVSRVLAGKPGVNAATRDKVLSVARLLGRTDGAIDDAAPLVGLVMPNVETRFSRYSSSASKLRLTPRTSRLS